jgi:cellulose synthase/poly-beta-1,6-N-acetylglucosamine synthase-like glycosyltransferase
LGDLLPEAIPLALSYLYSLAVLALSVYGFYGLVLTVIYWIWGRRVPSTPPAPAVWPVVTVQLPIFNEYDMLERLVGAVAAFDYPRDRLEVQVLDDSTDETARRARQLADRHRAAGLDIVHLHRTERKGFKAGALADGLAQARGEFVGVFDADFLPRPDFLKRVAPWFADPRVACVQTRWTHLNADDSWFTQAQAVALDRIFVVEQPAAQAAGWFVLFNGSAGVWRRAAIEAAGGWQDDTITEDMDLSYRAQLLGWRMVFLRDVTVPSELPAQLDAWKRQQFRWAKGSWQTLAKLAWPVLRAHRSPVVRLAALLNMAVYGMQPVMLAVLLLVPFVVWLRAPISPVLALATAAAIGPQLLLITAQLAQAEGRARRLWTLPLVYLAGVGMALNNTLAIAEAMRGAPNQFERTPKFGKRSGNHHWTRSRYALQRSGLVWAELALGLYALGGVALAAWHADYGLAPWLLVYVGGFGLVAGSSLWQDWLRRRSRARE